MTLEVRVDEEAQLVHITIPMITPKVTSSKKSILIASTSGHRPTKAIFRELPVAVNVNVYIPNKDN